MLYRDRTDSPVQEFKMSFNSLQKFSHQTLGTPEVLTWPPWFARWIKTAVQPTIIVHIWGEPGLIFPAPAQSRAKASTRGQRTSVWTLPCTQVWGCCTCRGGAVMTDQDQDPIWSLWWLFSRSTYFKADLFLNLTKEFWCLYFERVNRCFMLCLLLLTSPRNNFMI